MAEKHTAGAFDIRNIIGLLLTIYGVILTLMGIFADAETAKTGGINANLYAGIALLVVGLGFIAWSCPTTSPRSSTTPPARRPRSAPGRSTDLGDRHPDPRRRPRGVPGRPLRR